MTGQSDQPQTTPPEPPPPRSGCLTAFMVLAGIVLLLPGLCALILESYGARVGAFGGVAFLTALGGGLLIWWAFSRPSR